MSDTVDIIMVRHGESEWNLKNLFCGWYDSDLSESGLKEAQLAGEYLKTTSFKFDIAYTSLMKRAQNTLATILDKSGLSVPIEKTWRLNERHYGALTGLNKIETVEKYGAEQVAIWRRSFDTPPPVMEDDHPYYETIRKNPAYAGENGPTDAEFPRTESLKLTIERTLPFWNNIIVPKLNEKKRILIVAHGNSLRGIIKHLDNISDENITNLNLPTGIPFLYTLNADLKPIVSMKFLGDPEAVTAAIEKVANQTKKK